MDKYSREEILKPRSHRQAKQYGKIISPGSKQAPCHLEIVCRLKVKTVMKLADAPGPEHAVTDQRLSAESLKFTRSVIKISKVLYIGLSGGGTGQIYDGDC